MKYLKNYNTFILENKHTYNSKKFKNLIGLNISEIIDGDFACSNNFNLKSYN